MWFLVSIVASALVVLIRLDTKKLPLSFFLHYGCFLSLLCAWYYLAVSWKEPDVYALLMPTIVAVVLYFWVGYIGKKWIWNEEFMRNKKKGN